MCGFQRVLQQSEEETEQQHVPRPGEGASATEGAATPTFECQAAPNPRPYADVVDGWGGAQRGAPLSWPALQEHPCDDVQVRVVHCVPQLSRAHVEMCVMKAEEYMSWTMYRCSFVLLEVTVTPSIRTIAVPWEPS